MTARINVSVHACDEILAAGVVATLRTRPEIRLLKQADAEGADVSVVVADLLDDETVQLMRHLVRNGRTRIVLIAGALSDADLATAVEAGAAGLLRRKEATVDKILATIVGTARGEGSVPSDLLGRLLDQVGQLQRGVLTPRGLQWTGLASREVDVLRLVADGCDTAEIASELAYSERTVKNILHDVTSRLQLRNRSHAVAYALRQGLI